MDEKTESIATLGFLVAVVVLVFLLAAVWLSAFTVAAKCTLSAVVIALVGGGAMFALSRALPDEPVHRAGRGGPPV